MVSRDNGPEGLRVTAFCDRGDVALVFEAERLRTHGRATGFLHVNLFRHAVFEEVSICVVHPGGWPELERFFAASELRDPVYFDTVTVRFKDREIVVRRGEWRSGRFVFVTEGLMDGDEPRVIPAGTALGVASGELTLLYAGHAAPIVLLTESMQ